MDDSQLKKQILEIRNGNKFYTINYLFSGRYFGIKNENIYFDDLNDKIRYQIIRTILDYRSNDNELEKLIRLMEIEIGKDIPSRNTPVNKIKDFLSECSVEEFFTTLEIIISLKYDWYLVSVMFDRSHVINSTGAVIKIPNHELNKREEHFNSFIDNIDSIFKINNIKYEIVPVGFKRLPYLITPHISMETIKKSMSLLSNNGFEDTLSKFEKALAEYEKKNYEKSIVNITESFESALKIVLNKENVEFKNLNMHELAKKVQYKLNSMNKPLDFSLDFILALLANKLNAVKDLFKVSELEISIDQIERYTEFVLGTAGIYITYLIKKCNMASKGESININELRRLILEKLYGMNEESYGNYVDLKNLKNELGMDIDYKKLGKNVKYLGDQRLLDIIPDSSYYVAAARINIDGIDFFEDPLFYFNPFNKIRSTKLSRPEEVKPLDYYLISGETSKIEFKSTLRWDIEQNRVNKELDKVIAKSIAGFLNTGGGTLLIGISDDGSVYGIERDIRNAPHKNEDGFRLQLVEIIKSNLGAAFTKYIHVNIEKREGKKVCVVKVNPSHKPVFCGKEQIFYIRADNSTTPLSPKEMLEYKELHWDNQPVLDKKLIKDKKLVFECGNKPGAGMYMCTSCGKTLTLDDSVDVLPPCSSCSGCKFKRI